MELRVGEEALGSLKRGHLWVVTASGVIGKVQTLTSGLFFMNSSAALCLPLGHRRVTATHIPLKLLILPATTFHPQGDLLGSRYGPSLSTILLTGDDSHPMCPSRLVGNPS